MTAIEFSKATKELGIKSVDFGIIDTYSDNYKYVGFDESSVNFAKKRGSGYVGVSIGLENKDNKLLDLRLKEEDVIKKIFMTFK